MLDAETVVGSGTMKVACSREELTQKLAVVSRGVSTRTAVQILGGILLNAEGGQLMLAATDMELSLRASLEARVEGDGAVVVPGRLLVELARLLPDTEVSIEQRADEGVIHITSGSFESRPNTYTAEDFPRLPDAEGLERHTVDRDALLETIARVGRSASRDESRPVLTGILVRFESDKLVMAATDSYRRAVEETPAPGGRPAREAIIPARALQELSRLAAGADEVQLGLHENHVVFGAEGAWLTTRRIDGQFPNYRQLLPEQFEHELPLPREELLEVVRRVSLMAQRNSPLRLRFAEGELTISAQTQDVGEARESLPVGYAADAMEVGFNAEFLRDGLESVDSETVTLKLIARLPSAESLRRELSTLVFTPDRLAVVKGGPATRRAYFDRVLGRLLPARAGLPQDYASALAQRNASLRRVQLGLSGRDALAPWTARVAEAGTALVAARREVLARLAPGFAERAGELGLPEARPAYDAESPAVAALDARLEPDLERGSTGPGPHPAAG